MKHARKDYDRIQDPLGLIPEQEPVFLLRAQDVCFNDTLAFYCNLLVKKGVVPEQTFSAPAAPIIVSIQKHIALARQWQLNVKTKNPDLVTDADANLIIDKFNLTRSNLDVELQSYRESDGNQRAKIKELQIDLDLCREELSKALENSKLKTQETHNAQQSVAAMQQVLRSLREMTTIEEVKAYLVSLGKLPQDEVNKINRDQSGLPNTGGL